MIELVGTITKPKNQRNPGEFNYEEYLSRKGIVGVINCYKLETFTVTSHDIEFVNNLIFESRKKITA